MRYTYLFTQISREETGNLAPVTDKPNEFIFTFGKKIETFLKSPDNTVLFTKDMWKENPATNKEILPCVCFSVPSKQGYRRPLVMSKDADKRAGVYKYELVYENGIKDGKYLSEDLRLLIGIFVNGVRAMNDKTLPISLDELKNANVKYLMSYIKSYVYEQLLQDRDNRGIARSEEYLKNVLETFFSLIPDAMIEKFDKGLEVHDAIREKLEGVPEGDDAAIEAVLKSQNYFKTIGDYNLFVVLRDYILSVKNNFNHLVWVMYRSKIGLVSLKKVKKQLCTMFGFVSKVQDEYELNSNEEILKVMCGGDRYCKDVEGFLRKIYEQFNPAKMDKRSQAALCYKFMNECNLKYFDSRFKCKDKETGAYKPYHQEQFRDLCLRYWGIEEKNTYKLNKCEEQMNSFSSPLYDNEIWGPMKK